MTAPNVLTLQVVTRARANQAILEMEDPALVSYKWNYLTLKSFFVAKAIWLTLFKISTCSD